MHFDKNCFRPVQGETEALWIERQQFSIWFRVQHDEGETIFFVDETGFKIEMRTQYGRSKRGINAEGLIPNIRSRNISVVAAMSSTGLPLYEVLNGAGNADRFSHFIDDLARARDRLGYSNETILVMDNVSFHKSAIVTEMIELRGFTVKFLPPYSPYLNPIESMFGQWKNFVKSTFPKSEVELLHSINNIGNVVTRDHCENYCHHVRKNCLRILGGDRNNFN